MGYSLIIMPSAQKDFNEIVTYLKMMSSRAVARFTKEFKTKLGLLQSGTIEYRLLHVPELAKVNVRFCMVGRYVLLYKKEDSVIRIMRIFHGSQDYAKLFRKSTGGV